MYTVIEDCSPYYIRFTHDGINNVIDKCLNYASTAMFKPSTSHPMFTHHRVDLRTGLNILSTVPMTQALTINPARVSLFLSRPGLYYRAHKDGMDHRYSINYTIKILDNKCTTNWYSDNDLKDYTIDKLPTNDSRECDAFNKAKHTPLKSMIAIQGECILFNTDIFHDFDNSQSSNERLVLTLRTIRPGAMYFEDARKILFGGLV